MTKPQPTKQEDEKQFSLKAIELNMLGNINARHNAEVVDFLSFICIERLNYQPTEHTRFRTDENGNLYISEVVPETPDEIETEEVAVA